MKAILTGDMHVQKTLVHTDVIINYLDHLKNYYHENEIDYLFIIGDVFEKSTNIKNDAFIPLFLKFLELKDSGVKMIFILGNHDIINVNNDSIVETFSSFGRVVKTSEEIEFDDGESKFYFLSYTKNEDLIPAQGEYLITHLSIADFDFDNAYHATEKHAFKRAIFENWKQVFTGHFHGHQSKGNICYVGSPVQTNRGEMGQTKGFVVLDTEIEKWEFIEYPDAPTFIEVTADDLMNLKEADYSNNYVVLKVGHKIKEYAKLRYILYEKGALEIIPIFPEAEENVAVIDQDVEDNKNIEETTVSIIEELDDEELDKELLLKILKKAMA